jgi:hypothetical protein
MVVQRLRFYGAICAANLMLGSLVVGMGDAAERPHQLTESDFAAGQLVDSLFEAELPDSFTRDQRLSRKKTQRRAALRGKLVDNPNYRDGAPLYALVNHQGQVLRYVKRAEDIDLEIYLGESIAVRRDTGKILSASQLDLPKRVFIEEAQLLGFEESTPAEPDLAEESAEQGDSEESVLTPDSDQGPAIYDEGPTEVYDSEIDFGGCSDGSCQSCRGGCAMPGRGVMYAHGEFLMWWLEGMDTPPLVVSSPNSTFVPSDIIYGGTPILEDVRYGGRLTLGLWLDECGTWGLEADYLGLGTLEEVFTAGVIDGNDDNTDIGVALHIGRPYFNTAAFENNTLGGIVERGPAVEIVDSGELDGTVTVTSRSEFQSAGIRLRHSLCFAPGCCDTGCGDGVGCGSSVNCGSGVCPLNGQLGRLCRLIKCGNRRTDVLYGVRWARLDESLDIYEDLRVVGTGNFVGDAFDVNDHFATRNDFFGGEVGFMMEWERRRWSLGFLSKVAIGNTRQRVDINGSTTFDGEETAVGGLLTQSYDHPGGFTVGNIGRYERNEFSMLPELGATLGYCVTPRFKLTAGYTLLYWSNVVRPGDQIDIDVNGNLIPSNLDGEGVDPDEVVPGDHPRFEFRQTDLWAQGINLGGEYRW